MIKILKIFIVVMIISNPSFAKTNNNIAYIDLQFILNQSNPGISIKKEIEKLNTNLKNEISALESNLKKRDNELIAKKNILEEKEFNTLVTELRNDIKKFNAFKNKKNLEIKKKKIEYDLKLINTIKPILTDFSKSKNISILFQKKTFY